MEHLIDCVFQECLLSYDEKCTGDEHGCIPNSIKCKNFRVERMNRIVTQETLDERLLVKNIRKALKEN